ncbi:Redox-sensitive transcriptional activator SoxR [Hartmannibacter diazotrophicus]|uniref:Redox-sensitive transcriptional activator SoxR n=1 Tax=Hartmannibacter diazotrophicus TaxID=1482074 RepID=A0A2C9D8P0_9HYPH|nr:redox-sensitive transcriptional activator SoxR [Hartmannibacter diazotrophicus]SON56549.1 Redox-sensitive transcriptional activator SoxR [Hartmannibacter diazotrophicus]
MTPISPTAARLLSVGEVVRRSGLPVSTLHYYEAEGLIGALRSAGNQRRYPRGVLRRLAVIRVALQTGIPIRRIKEALAPLPRDRAPSAEDWKHMSALWRDDLQARIDQLTRLRDQLDGCIGCGCLSLAECPLRNPDDILAAKGPGARLLMAEGERAADDDCR